MVQSPAGVSGPAALTTTRPVLARRARGRPVSVAADLAPELGLADGDLLLKEDGSCVHGPMMGLEGETDEWPE